MCERERSSLLQEQHYVPARHKWTMGIDLGMTHTVVGVWLPEEVLSRLVEDGTIKSASASRVHIIEDPDGSTKGMILPLP